MVQHAPRTAYPLSRGHGEWASATEGSKCVSHSHESSLHLFVLLEFSAVRSGRGNQQPCLTANGAVALHSSASYSVGTG